MHTEPKKDNIYFYDFYSKNNEKSQKQRIVRSVELKNAAAVHKGVRNFS